MLGGFYQGAFVGLEGRPKAALGQPTEHLSAIFACTPVTDMLSFCRYNVAQEQCKCGHRHDGWCFPFRLLLAVSRCRWVAVPCSPFAQMSGEKKRTYADLSIGGHHKDELPDKKQHVDNPAVYRVGPLQVAHAEADAHATAAPGSDLSLSHTQSSVPPLQTPPMQMPTHSGREPEGASEPQPQPGHAQAQAQAQAPGPGGDACATPEAPPAARSPKCDAVDVLSSDEEMEAAPVDGTPLPCRPAIPIHHFVRCDRVEAPGTWRALFACAQPIAEPDPVADYLVLTDKGSLAVVVELMEVSVCKYHVKGSPFVLVLECQLRGSVKGPVTVPGATPGASPGASPADHLRVYNRSEGPMDLQMRTVRSKWVLALEFSSADARAVQRALAPFPPGGHSEMSAAEARQYKAGTHPHLTQVDPPRTVGRKVTSDLRVAHRQGIAVTVGDYARLVPEIKNKRSAAQAHLNDSLIDFFIGQTAGTDDRCCRSLDFAGWPHCRASSAPTHPLAFPLGSHTQSSLTHHPSQLRIGKTRETDRKRARAQRARTAAAAAADTLQQSVHESVSQ